ncbi:MAG: ABC transporter ATP-binding protein [Acidisphaera sp.]|nr:ABC transporter ATP-binding protein [Acidisphaera sp.]
MASVSAESISKIYGSTRVVDDVSLTVEQGEFVVLLGPSGCGKTSTLRMIAGFVQPSAGRIVIGGEDVTNVAPRLRKIGMVFQNYALFPNMSVAENIAFGLRQQRADRRVIQARVAELLELIRMPDRGASSVSALSGGQQQRVALARALAVSPRVLLMDEPLGALDLKLREAMQLELARIQRALRITTILVTHDQQEAMSLADRIVVMAHGRIQQIGTPDDLYRRPRNRFVAEFVGRNNILRGCIEGAGGEGSRLALRGGITIPVATPRTVASGATVEVAIRPQHMALCGAGAAEGSGVRGRIEARRFLGTAVQYSVRLASDDLLLVESPAEGDPPDPGETVCLTWDRHRTLLFNAEGQAIHDPALPDPVLHAL